jgi:hypothetical protein
MQPTSEIPEDVKAEMDLEARRLGAAPVVPPAPEAVPEDVRSELDHQQRVAEETVVRTLAEGGPSLGDAAEEAE